MPRMSALHKFIERNFDKMASLARSENPEAWNATVDACLPDGAKAWRDAADRGDIQRANGETSK